MARLLLTRAAAARGLSVSLPTLDRLIRAGHLRVLRLGRAVRVPEDELRRLSRFRTGRIETGPGSSRRSRR
jgi:excisionase family DNA binding protein